MFFLVFKKVKKIIIFNPYIFIDNGRYFSRIENKGQCLENQSARFRGVFGVFAGFGRKMEKKKKNKNFMFFAMFFCSTRVFLGKMTIFFRKKTQKKTKKWRKNEKNENWDPQKVSLFLDLFFDPFLDPKKVSTGTFP